MHYVLQELKYDAGSKPNINWKMNASTAKLYQGVTWYVCSLTVEVFLLFFPCMCGSLSSPQIRWCSWSLPLRYTLPLTKLNELRETKPNWNHKTIIMKVLRLIYDFISWYTRFITSHYERNEWISIDFLATIHINKWR